VSGSLPISYSTLGYERPSRILTVRVARWLAAGLFWTLLGGILVAGSAFAVASASNVLLGALTPVAAILLLVAGATLARGARRVRDLSVLYYVEHAIRLDASLPAMIAAAEQNEHGAVRSGLGRLRRRLTAGDPVSTALAIAAPALSKRMIGVLMAGEITGQMPAAMRRITVRRDFLPAGDPTDSIFHRWYPLIVLTGCFVGMQGYLIFVLPKMNFFVWRQGLPRVSHNAWMQALTDNFGYVIFAIAALAILLLCGRMLAQFFTPLGMTLGPLRNVADAVGWFTPFAGVGVRSRALGDVCYVIAHALDAGVAPHRAVVEAATASDNFILERRMRRWASEMLAGSDMALAARKARLPTLLCDMLAGADKDLHEIFQFLFRYYDGRFSRVAMLLRGAIIPLVAIAGGIVVLGVANGVFEPLVGLMNKFASQH